MDEATQREWTYWAERLLKEADYVSTAMGSALLTMLQLLHERLSLLEQQQLAPQPHEQPSQATTRQAEGSRESSRTTEPATTDGRWGAVEFIRARILELLQSAPPGTDYRAALRSASAALLDASRELERIRARAVEEPTSTYPSQGSSPSAEIYLSEGAPSRSESETRDHIADAGKKVSPGYVDHGVSWPSIWPSVRDEG